MRNRVEEEPEFVEVTIDSAGFEGVAVARLDGMVHLVKGAVPGDRALVRVKRRRKKHVEASLERVIEPSVHRVTPPCTHFGTCGGCSWQQMSYSAQLDAKRNHVVDCFERIGHVPVGEILPTLASPRTFFYRNKMEFSFSVGRWRTEAEMAEPLPEIPSFALGLHIPGRFDKVLDIDFCHIQPEIGNPLLTEVRGMSKELGLSAHNPKTNTGFLRNLVVRTSHFAQDAMAMVVTRSPASEAESAFVQWLGSGLPAQVPGLTSVIHAINDTRSPVAPGPFSVLFGNGSITESICGVRFRISPTSFFQTNSWQLDGLIGTVVDEVTSLKPSFVWDLYCGTGAITLPLAKNVKRVIGIELSAQSIADAKENAILNSIENADFKAEDLHKPEAIRFLESLSSPDVIVIDPPRAGVHENLLRHILAVRAKHVVYVSCNPATQARDCAILSEGYRVVRSQPVDMFPHTSHVENIALLESHAV